MFIVCHCWEMLQSLATPLSCSVVTKPSIDNSINRLLLTGKLADVVKLCPLIAAACEGLVQETRQLTPDTITFAPVQSPDRLMRFAERVIKVSMSRRLECIEFSG